MNNGNPAAREPEIFREQVNLNERIESMDKASQELNGEIRQLESELRIALRPEQDRPKASGTETPEPPPCITPLADGMRSSADSVRAITRSLGTMIERVRDIRDRCELPRLPEPILAEKMPEYPTDRGMRIEPKY